VRETRYREIEIDRIGALGNHVTGEARMGIPRPRRLQHIGLVARDLDRMVDFYCEVIGLHVSDRMPYPEDDPISEGIFLRCNADHHVISMFGLRDPAPPQESDRAEPRPGLHHFAFEMGSFEELRAAAAYVREHDLPVRAMRIGGPGCQLRIYFWDPENNLIELYWALDQIGWDGRSRPYPPFETVDIETFDIDAWIEWKGPEFSRDADRAHTGEEAWKR
jgi:catechol 2,3-dioxygenase-like lactoylglutathione lyase family enzyme